MAESLNAFIPFAREGTLRDVIALYREAVRGRARSFKVQPCEDPYLERGDFMFPSRFAARSFVASLYAQNDWAFQGAADVSVICPLKVVVVIDHD